MRLTVLGSGTCQLWEGRSSPGYLLETADQTMILDLGQGALRRLCQAGKAPADLNAALISHHHLDHMADLLPLLFGLNYDPVTSVRASITLMASAKFAEVLEGLRAVYGKWIDPPAPALHKVFLEPGEKINLGETLVATARAKHIETSIAFRISSGGASLAYLGDCAYCQSAVELAKGADLLIAHLGGGDQDMKPMHLYPAAAGELAAQAGVSALLLSHLYSHMDIKEAVLSASKTYSGPIFPAHDLQVLDIGPGKAHEIE
jgi:ribonuclease Z